VGVLRTELHRLVWSVTSINPTFWAIPLPPLWTASVIVGASGPEVAKAGERSSHRMQHPYMLLTWALT
jgi:hypothetical protein